MGHLIGDLNLYGWVGLHSRAEMRNEINPLWLRYLGHPICPTRALVLRRYVEWMCFIILIVALDTQSEGGKGITLKVHIQREILWKERKWTE